MIKNLIAVSIGDIDGIGLEILINVGLKINIKILCYLLTKII